jgi:uncharacterized membrane protein
MDFIAVNLMGIQIILGFFLLLFVPGFAISLVYYPRPTDIGLIERLVYSMVLSIGSVIVLVLFMDVILGMNMTPRNISIIIIGFSFFAFIVWQCEKKYGNSWLKSKLDSLISMDYFNLRNYIKRFKDSIGNRIGLRKEDNL